jgi:hypothetical protein
LTPFQCNLLLKLHNSQDFIVFPSDKYLGPCVLERTKYIKKVLEHLADDKTYRQLTSNKANSTIHDTHEMVLNFADVHHRRIIYSDEKFIQRSLDVYNPFAYFYIAAQIHKNP